MTLGEAYIKYFRYMQLLPDSDLDWLSCILSDKVGDAALFTHVEQMYQLSKETFHLGEMASLHNDILKAKLKKQLDILKTFYYKQLKIVLAVPQRKKHGTLPAPNLGGLVIPQNLRVKGEVCYGKNYVDARTELVELALKDPDATHIMFIDDDILLPLDALTKLTEAKEPIISCNYVKKRFPIESIALSTQPSKIGFSNAEVVPHKEFVEPIEVSQAGLGATLIDLNVFKIIEKPWFEFIYNKDGSVFAGEDVRFHQKAIVAGYKPKIIPGLVAVHVDFKTGKQWGPDWLVQDHCIKREYADKYCFLQCHALECYSEDIK